MVVRSKLRVASHTGDTTGTQVISGNDDDDDVGPTVIYTVETSHNADVITINNDVTSRDQNGAKSLVKKTRESNGATVEPMVNKDTKQDREDREDRDTENKSGEEKSNSGNNLLQVPQRKDM